MKGPVCRDAKCEHPEHRGPQYEAALYAAFCDMFITWAEYQRELKLARARTEQWLAKRREQVR